MRSMTRIIDADRGRASNNAICPVLNVSVTCDWYPDPERDLSQQYRSGTPQMIRTQEETRQEIEELIETNDWWILIDVGKSELPWIIKEHFYADCDRDEFRMLLGPVLAYQPVAFFILSKRRMNAEELARCVAEAGGESLPPALYEKRPFLFSPRTPTPTALANAFYDWLED